MAKNEDLLQGAIDAFTSKTGLKVEAKTPASAQDNFEHWINIHFRECGQNKTKEFVAEVIRHFTQTTLSKLLINKDLNRSGWYNGTQKLLLVCDYVTPKAAEILREKNVSYFDCAGNAYLNEPGLFVYITGQRRPGQKLERQSLFSAAGTKLTFALLRAPDLVDRDYRTIERQSNVPRSTIGRLITKMDQDGYVILRNKVRHLKRKKELFARWCVAYNEILRPKLNPVRFRSTKYSGRWWNEIDIREFNAVWGGETGGAKLTRHLKPQRATIYADTLLPKLQLKYGLIRDKNGELEILKRFWKPDDRGEIAPPLVVYADLIATADERNLETAKLIYDECLAPTIEENS